MSSILAIAMGRLQIWSSGYISAKVYFSIRGRRRFPQTRMFAESSVSDSFRDCTWFASHLTSLKSEIIWYLKLFNAISAPAIEHRIGWTHPSFYQDSEPDAPSSGRDHKMSVLTKAKHEDLRETFDEEYDHYKVCSASNRKAQGWFYALPSQEHFRVRGGVLTILQMVNYLIHLRMRHLNLHQTK